MSLLLGLRKKIWNGGAGNIIHPTSPHHDEAPRPSVRSDVACRSAALSFGAGPTHSVLQFLRSARRRFLPRPRMAAYQHVIVTARANPPHGAKTLTISTKVIPTRTQHFTRRIPAHVSTSAFCQIATSDFALSQLSHNGFLQGPRQARQGDPSPRPYRYDSTAPRAKALERMKGD